MELWKYGVWILAEGFDGINTYMDAEVSFRKETGRRITMVLSADTNYAFELGGKLFFGQYADYPFDKVYDRLDLTEAAEDGENRITIRCWHQGDDSSTVRGERAGLIFEIFSDKECAAYSGPHILTRPVTAYAVGPGVEHVSGQLGYSFHYDSRVRLPDPAPALTADKPLPARERPIRRLLLGEDEPALLTVSGTFAERGGDTVGKRMQYAALTFGEQNRNRRLPSEDGIRLEGREGEDGIFALIDTGRENAGLLSLDIEVPGEAEILVGWGEHLEDLRVRTYVGGRNFAASYYARAGRNRFVHPFRRLGMRYLQLHIRAKEARIRYAGIRTTDYPLEHETEFFCADSLHTKIFDVSKRTLLMCMHEHYEDCPWREQALYSMDSRNQMLCGYLAFHELDFPKASIRLMAQSVREDDLLELCSPARVSITIPSFTAIFLTQVWEYLIYSEKITGTADAAFVLEILPVMKRIADMFLRRRDPETGLIPCFTEQKYWNFYEWQNGLDGSISGSVAEDDVTFDAPLCAFVSFGLRSLADTLEKLEDPGEAAFYRQEHLRLNEAIDRFFWDGERSVYATYMNRKTGKRYHYAELTNALVIYADAAEGERLKSTLVGLTGKSGLLPVTLSHSIFKYDALMREPEKYARFVFADIARQWGAMLESGATTFWETIKGAQDFGNAGSLCHGWAAVPIRFYAEHAVKLDGTVTGLYECAMKQIK